MNIVLAPRSALCRHLGTSISACAGAKKHHTHQSYHPFKRQRQVTASVGGCQATSRLPFLAPAQQFPPRQPQPAGCQNTLIFCNLAPAPQFQPQPPQPAGCQNALTPHNLAPASTQITHSSTPHHTKTPGAFAPGPTHTINPTLKSSPTRAWRRCAPLLH